MSVSRINGKRKAKNEKWGFGGKKRGVKSNTKESSNDVSDFRSNRKSPGGGAAKKKKIGGNKRPGKNVRKQMKNRKK